MPRYVLLVECRRDTARYSRGRHGPSSFFLVLLVPVACHQWYVGDPVASPSSEGFLLSFPISPVGSLLASSMWKIQGYPPSCRFCQVLVDTFPVHCLPALAHGTSRNFALQWTTASPPPTRSGSQPRVEGDALPSLFLP